MATLINSDRTSLRPKQAVESPPTQHDHSVDKENVCQINSRNSHQAKVLITQPIRRIDRGHQELSCGASIIEIHRIFIKIHPLQGQQENSYLKIYPIDFVRSKIDR